jgi:tRNA-2-methylthio-N6-dimethylallyladenosine synthase
VSDVPGVARVRFASPHPRHVGSRLVEAIRAIPQVCKHVHLPAQSGSDRILAAMRRRHTRHEYLTLVSRLREAVPAVALSTDLIVGFPGETVDDFELTLDLVRTVRFHSIFSFKYSPRPGTLAMKRMPDDVSEAEKTRRILALQQLQREVQYEINRAAVGGDVEVLVDSISKRRDWEVAGRTTGNTIVNFPGGRELIGGLVRVRVTDAGPNSLRGELLGPAEPQLEGVAGPC